MKRFFSSLEAFLGFCVLSSPVPAESSAIHACADNKTGVLRMVEDAGKCRPTETHVAWDRRGLQGPEGPRGPKGARGVPGNPGGVHVYDSNGQYMGLYLGSFPTTSCAEIFIPDIEKSIFIDRLSGGTCFQAPREAYYETADCSGIGIVGENFVDVVLQDHPGGHPGEKYYLVTSKRRAMNVKSHRHEDQCSPLVEELWGQEIIEIPKEEIPFTLPVKMPLKYEYRQHSSGKPVTSSGGHKKTCPPSYTTCAGVPVQADGIFLKSAVLKSRRVYCGPTFREFTVAPRLPSLP